MLRAQSAQPCVFINNVNAADRICETRKFASAGRHKQTAQSRTAPRLVANGAQPRAKGEEHHRF
jgi:hypothetical protein